MVALISQQHICLYLLLQVITGKTPWDGLKGVSLEQRRFRESTFGTPTRPPGMPDTVWDFVQSCTRINAKERIKASRALAIVQRFVDSGMDWHLTPQQRAIFLPSGLAFFTIVVFCGASSLFILADLSMLVWGQMDYKYTIPLHIFHKAEINI